MLFLDCLNSSSILRRELGREENELAMRERENSTSTAGEGEEHTPGKELLQTQ
jgi:hypothetical protein